MIRVSTITQPAPPRNVLPSTFVMLGVLLGLQKLLQGIADSISHLDGRSRTPDVTVVVSSA